MFKNRNKSFRFNCAFGALALGLCVSMAAADLVPIGPVSRKLSCGNECTIPGSTTCSGGRLDVACCCRPDASSAWACTCVWPTDCTNEGTRRCDMASV